MRGTHALRHLSGSSPRMRGALRHIHGARRHRRIIPAYAGSTRGHGLWSGARKDHPRVCGEHPREPATNSPYSGSSPRMRGAPRRRTVLRARDGIIPAYAGSTNSRATHTMTRADHPRVCGEHPPQRPLTTTGSGSSPRMRGAPSSGWVSWISFRIIPAYAGSTATPSPQT